MKIAIHNRAGSFSEYWIEYCKVKSIPHKVVNCYDNDIVQQIDDCDALMWHFSNYNYRDMIGARHVLFTAQQMGKRVFPDYHTSWHFDDKVAQKYLLESIGAPLVPTYVYYDKNEALNFVENADYPLVFKLRKGAGSISVKLIKNKKQARRVVKKAFGKGIPQMSFIRYFFDRLQKHRKGRESFWGVMKGFARIFIKNEYYKMTFPEKGYVYFQEYIENDGFDIRVAVIGNKAVALKRLVREGDFRASGGGRLVYENSNADIQIIKLAFSLSSQLKTQSVAFDFVIDKNSNTYLIEMSYGFPMYNFLDKSSGYWKNDLTWVEDDFNIQHWMVENIINC